MMLIEQGNSIQRARPSPAANTLTRPGLQFSASPGLGTWLDARAGVLAVSTMTSELLLFLAGNGAGGISAVARNFGMTRGISVDRARMWVAGDTRIFHLVNKGAQTVGTVEHDALYVPQRVHFVGNCLLHDIAHAVNLGGEQHDVLFVSTSYSVIATVDETHSFRPLWKPRHITRLLPDDRCHFNCIGIRDGKATYASFFSLTDSAEGWRDAKPGSGVIVDIASQEVICAGLTKQHSLQWHNGRLWVLDSGSGEFGYVDEGQGRFVPVTHLGNFLRGLVMIDDYAVIGATALRGQPFNNDVSIPGFVDSAKSLLASAIYVVDLRSGEVDHALMMSGIHGVYDVAFMPGTARPLVAKLDGAEDNAKWTTFAPDLSLGSFAGGAAT